MNDRITCPSCNHKFELSAVLLAQVTGQVRAEYESRRQQQESAHEEELREVRQKLLDEQRKLIQVERAQASAAAVEEAGIEIKALKEQLDAKNRKLTGLRERELSLLQAQRELGEQQEAFELEKARQLEQERQSIKEEASRQADERHRLKEAEWNRQREAMNKQIDDLRRKAEQGSQELQGEVLELDIEETLRREFPLDGIDPVGKGKRGADLVQEVRNDAGRCCGRILWESKRARNWNGAWLPKLRNDQREAKAELAVLVTDTMPPGTTSLASIDGVWVVSRECLPGVAAILRTVLLEAAAAAVRAEGRQSKMELLYEYLSGPEFRHRVAGIVEAFQTMNEDLAKERASMERHWAKREKELVRAITSASGLYGDLQGIAGCSFPELEHLELRLPGANDDISAARTSNPHPAEP